MNLNDVFPDGIMGEGIFYSLNEYNVPWKNSISSVALDLEYYGNVSGGKTISPLLRRLLVDGVVPTSSVTRLANSLYSMNALRWRKLWDTYELEYNPIQNYDMTETMTDDETVTEYGKSKTRTDNLSTTRTDNLSHGKTGTESDSRDLEDNTDTNIYGFNSSNASPADKVDKTVSEDTTRTFNTTETDTGTETTAHSGTQTEADNGSDTQTRNYILTRSGNIGVTTSQQMIESERALWMWKYFYDVVFPDVDKMLTISVYSDDVIPIISGGITPTGEISITLNGDYNVTEYASAVVNVPNTYDESDNGMVVYNGELVSQIGREISENGTYDTTLNNAIVVNVPNTYTSADEGKVVDNGALVTQGSETITENGTYDTTLNNAIAVNVPNTYTSADEGKVVDDGELVAQGSQTITENGTYDTTLVSELIANISGGGSDSIQGFELYAADFNGNARTHKGKIDNQYFACFFHDNMSANYTLNGETYAFMTGAGHNTQTRGSTKAVANNTPTGLNAIIDDGSSFSTSHGDSGSYISVVGGWCGYPNGGTIYEQMATGTTNSITMNSAHEKLLVFVGASQRGSSIDTVDINGVEYSINNNGAKYDDVYGEYGAIEIDNNSNATIVVTFPASCYNYVSIVGLD